MRKYLMLAIATVLAVSSNTTFAQEENSTPLVTSNSSWEDITNQLNNADVNNVIRDIVMNNEQFLADALSYLASNNPESLVGAMNSIKQYAPTLAASAFATITQLLAGNEGLLQRLNEGNQELVAQILNGNVEVLPAAGPNLLTIRERALARLQAQRNAAAENARQSSPN